MPNTVPYGILCVQKKASAVTNIDIDILREVESIIRNNTDVKIGTGFQQASLLTTPAQKLGPAWQVLWLPQNRAGSTEADVN